MYANRPIIATALPRCLYIEVTNRCMILGNAFRAGGFASAYNGSKYLELRERFLSDAPPASCVGCGSQWSI